MAGASSRCLSSARYFSRLLHARLDPAPASFGRLTASASSPPECFDAAEPDSSPSPQKNTLAPSPFFRCDDRFIFVFWSPGVYDGELI
jgi:hypothetical protein